MTQVQEWSNAELNRKLAELMGYTVRTYRNGKSVLIGPNLRIVSAKECFPDEVWEDAPDYCTDPAASLEVQTAAIKVSIRYVDTLVEVMKPENMAYSRACVAELLNATPRERAEAAYITLQGQ
jgi:hypothetical protein